MGLGQGQAQGQGEGQGQGQRSEVRVLVRAKSCVKHDVYKSPHKDKYKDVCVFTG